MTQIVADETGIPVEKIRPELGDGRNTASSTSLRWIDDNGQRAACRTAGGKRSA